MFPINIENSSYSHLFKPKIEPCPPFDIDLECHDDLEDTEIITFSWESKDPETLTIILQAESSDPINPNYLTSCQPHLSPSMRAVLYDWIFEVSSELCMKRDTTFYAMSYVDRLLSKVENIKKENFQLVGLTALYIAAKLEEIYPCKISDFAKAADNGYSIKSIRNTEIFMMNTLKWRITGPTVYSVVNWLMSQWDSFLHFHFGHIPQNSPDYYSVNLNVEEQRAFENRYVSFKMANHVSYRRFRETLQVLDAFCLSSEGLKYTSRSVSAGLVFLAISEYFRQTKYELITFRTEFSDLKYEISDLQTATEKLLNDFITASLSFESLDEVCPAASALFPFFKIELNNDLPPVCKFQTKQRLEAHYEEFLSYQTHNPNSLVFVKSYLKQNSK